MFVAFSHISFFLCGPVIITSSEHFHHAVTHNERKTVTSRKHTNGLGSNLCILSFCHYCIVYLFHSSVEIFSVCLSLLVMKVTFPLSWKWILTAALFKLNALQWKNCSEIKRQHCPGNRFLRNSETQSIPCLQPTEKILVYRGMD